MVFVIEKFRSYLVGTKVIDYTDHAAQVSHDEERCKIMPDPMDTSTPRI
jgi:hypothetical protein